MVLNQNPRDTNVILGPDYRTLWGRDFLEETLCGMTFRLSVPSFFQINRAQTERLYAQAPGLRRAHWDGDRAGPLLRHRDHLPGPGPAGRPGHRRGNRPQAIEDAKANAARNGVGNVRFPAVMRDRPPPILAQEGIRPQVICVDPPRKGLAPEVPAILAGMAPERIVYVSCDPATLARDVKRLAELGYRTVRPRAWTCSPGRPIGDGMFIVQT